MKVSRRSALKSIGAALCLSRLRILDPAQPTEIPWQFFCDEIVRHEAARMQTQIDRGELVL